MLPAACTELSRDKEEHGMRWELLADPPQCCPSAAAGSLCQQERACCTCGVSPTPLLQGGCPFSQERGHHPKAA